MFLTLVTVFLGLVFPVRAGWFSFPKMLAAVSQVISASTAMTNARSSCLKRRQTGKNFTFSEETMARWLRVLLELLAKRVTVQRSLILSVDQFCDRRDHRHFYFLVLVLDTCHMCPIYSLGGKVYNVYDVTDRGT